MTPLPPVRLRAAVADAIVRHARDEAPNECCGLLVGAGHAIDECVPAPNLRASPTRYLLDPAVHAATIRRLRGTRRRVVGAYHSHPASPPIPSETDEAEAFYPDFIWMIVSLAVSPPPIAAYVVEEGRWQPRPYIVEP